ncbi:Hydrolase-4 domain-containing protein [Mycena kentingensis (nom. inval.)]|nr:Hydrolase-4 domain-containing protein [Mycena kentingensis (nom. inval.)]
MPLHKVEDMASDAYTEAWLEGPQQTNFYTRTYTAAPDTAKANLVFVHGFAEHIGRYTEAHPEFAKRGINVFAFDERGFGKTALDKANKSKNSAYGKTSGPDQMEDIKWALGHVAEAFPGLPVFLAGHSMGGGEVLSFATRHSADAVAALKGVIASSPLIRQTNPAPVWQRKLGGFVGNAIPNQLIPAPLKYSDLSHDKGYNDMCRTDSLSILQGSLRGLSDMLNWGEELLAEHYKSWPKSLPVLFLHGSGDPITSHAASQQFHDKIVADDKEHITYVDAFHELVHEPDHRGKLLEDMIVFIEKRVSTAVEPDAEAIESKL